MRWAYGITTVPQRLESTFPQTLSSLREAGFDNPRLFIDNAPNARQYEKFGLETSTHYPALRTFGNWVASMWELYVRNPHAERYAIFQDDFITYRNLRQYLEKCPYPDKGYWNLFTFMENQLLCPPKHQGWFKSNQLGKGAVALVMDRAMLVMLFTSEHMILRPQNANRGWKSVDGGIISAAKKAGFTEYTHNPSLVQHTGFPSSIQNRKYPPAPNFNGPEFDALELLNEQRVG